MSPIQDHISTNDNENTICLCDQGDVTLVVGEESASGLVSFLVSSQVLALASPVFDRMFNGDMIEAGLLKENSKLKLSLKDDDPQAMERVLLVIHHGLKDKEDPGIDLLARIALAADKYDCQSILQPWMAQWIEQNDRTPMDPIDIGRHLLIAYKLRMKKFFEKFWGLALRQLTQAFPEDWESCDMLQILPETLISSLLSNIHRQSSQSRQILERAEASLRQTGPAYSMYQQECTMCGRKPPSEAKKCHPCNNSELRARLCTDETRVADYMLAIRQAELWGFSSPLECLSLTQTAVQVTFARDHTRHRCGAGKNCPLLEELERAVTKICLLRDNAIASDVAETSEW